MSCSVSKEKVTLVICDQALSVSQLKALGPDNAAAVTETQRSGLSVDQKATLDEAMGLKTVRAEVPTGNSTGISSPGSSGSVPLPLKGGK